MTTPTPPPRMEIWKLAGTISDERLPEGAFYWNDSATYPRWEEATTMYPKDWLTYAIPTHPTTGDTTNEKANGDWWNCQAHGLTAGECQCGAATSLVKGKPVEQRQELDLSRLIRSIPCDVRKHVSYHDLKRIVENYNAQ